MAQTEPKHTEPKKQQNFARSLAEKLVSGAIAGIIGSSSTFPLDVVKTRLQNQKIGPNGEKQYKNMLDCFMKSYRMDGIKGLYRGLPAVLIGITPEKAIKLGVNDFVCEIFKARLNTETLPILYMVAAGAIAGFSQVIATNPMEITKIRMQVQGQIPGAQRQSMGEIVRELGLRGLYKGAPATLLRDVPFSMVYFSIYGFLKQKWTPPDGNVSTWRVFCVAFVAGSVAASFSTPADVIKTRIQAKPVPGQEPYKGIVDCFTRTVKNEGWLALTRGIGPRIIVISPLFGVALAVYEIQKKLLLKLGI